MSSDEEDPGVWAKRIWSSRNGGKTATASSQRSRQRSKGGSGVVGRSSSSSSAFASYTALTASLLAAGGPFTPTPPPAGPSSAATTKTTSTTTSMSLPKMTTKSRSSNNNKCGSKIDDEKENVLPANHTNNPNSCNIKIMTPSKSKLNIDDGENENAPPVIQSPPPYWKVLNERGGKTSPRTTRSASKKALQKTTATTTIDANNNCSFKRRMQDRYELANDNDDDDDDEGIVATRSCGSGNYNIDPTTLLHFSLHNKQFEIESVRISKRRRDAELQKESSQDVITINSSDEGDKISLSASLDARNVSVQFEFVNANIACFRDPNPEFHYFDFEKNVKAKERRETKKKKEENELLLVYILVVYSTCRICDQKQQQAQHKEQTIHNSSNLSSIVDGRTVWRQLLELYLIFHAINQ